jgi:hypothetical protein
MKWSTAITMMIVAACGDIGSAQTAPNPESSASADTPPPDAGLKDLDAMTFACPKAALNAAAREAAKVQAQGTYQFAYFNIITGSHHARYEVHFKSNYPGEPDLKYCVMLYCQQGWDPGRSQTSVMLINPTPPANSAAAPHMSSCTRSPATPAKRTKHAATQHR